jgi:hypothetical protein
MREPFEAHTRGTHTNAAILDRSAADEFVSLDLLLALNDGSTVGNAFMESAYCGREGRRRYLLRFGTAALNRHWNVQEPVTLTNVERLTPRNCHFNGVSMIDGQIVLLPTTGGLTIGQRIDGLTSAGNAELEAGRISLDRILTDQEAFNSFANRRGVSIELERRQAFTAYTTRGLRLARDRMNELQREHDAHVGGTQHSAEPHAQAPVTPRQATASLPFIVRGNTVTVTTPAPVSPWHFRYEAAITCAFLALAFVHLRQRFKQIALSKDTFVDPHSGQVELTTAVLDVAREPWKKAIVFALEKAEDGRKSILIDFEGMAALRRLLFLYDERLQGQSQAILKTGGINRELEDKNRDLGEQLERLHKLMPVVPTALDGVQVPLDLVEPKPGPTLAEQTSASIKKLAAEETQRAALEKATKRNEALENENARLVGRASGLVHRVTEETERNAKLVKANEAANARANTAEASLATFKQVLLTGLGGIFISIRHATKHLTGEEKYEVSRALASLASLIHDPLGGQVPALAFGGYVDEKEDTASFTRAALEGANAPPAASEAGPKPLNGNGAVHPKLPLDAEAPKTGAGSRTIPGPAGSIEDAAMPSIPGSAPLPLVGFDDDPTQVGIKLPETTVVPTVHAHSSSSSNDGGGDS